MSEKKEKLSVGQEAAEKLRKEFLSIRRLNNWNWYEEQFASIIDKIIEERGLGNETPPTLDIETLLGQATPLPLEMHIAYDVTGYPVLNIHGLSGEQKRNSEMLDATMKLIVLAVNALPAFLKLREAARLLHDDIDEYLRINHLGGHDNHAMVLVRAALSEVDTALGLSKKPSQTPVDTVRKQKSVLFDEKTKEAIESLRENVKSWSKPIAGADYNQIAKHILTVCNFAEEKEE